jgi:hypothetical protein
MKVLLFNTFIHKKYFTDPCPEGQGDRSHKNPIGYNAPIYFWRHIIPDTIYRAFSRESEGKKNKKYSSSDT